jgi:hypothetical protein
MTADRVPQRVQRKAGVAVMRLTAVVARVRLEVAAAEVAWSAFAGRGVALRLVLASTARFVAGELVALAPWLAVAVERAPIVALTVAALEFRAAALAVKHLMARESVPERMQRCALMVCVETIVHIARTGKTVLMTHSGYSRECLKMCLKIYI